MRRALYLLLAVVAIMASSCGLEKKTAETVRVNNTLNNYPVVADLQVGKKVTESVEWVNILFYSPLSLDVTKGNLIAKTLDENDGDVLLEPQFIVEKEGFPPFYSKNRIVVTGFVGKYKNFRNASEADLEALKVSQKLPLNQSRHYNSDDDVSKIVVRYEPPAPAHDCHKRDEHKEKRHKEKRHK